MIKLHLFHNIHWYCCYRFSLVRYVVSCLNRNLIQKNLFFKFLVDIQRCRQLTVVHQHFPSMINFQRHFLVFDLCLLMLLASVVKLKSFEKSRYCKMGLSIYLNQSTKHLTNCVCSILQFRYIGQSFSPCQQAR